MEINATDVVLCEFYFSDLKTNKKRPVLVLKDNLPYDDFIGIPISSQIEHLHVDEQILNNTAFSSGDIPKPSKLIIRKTFVISKSVVIKKYGTLYDEAFAQYHQAFCEYFGCV
jgi:mRNA interferase MazF